MTVKPNTKEEIIALMQLPKGTKIECTIVGNEPDWYAADDPGWNFEDLHYRPAKPQLRTPRDIYVNEYRDSPYSLGSVWVNGAAAMETGKLSPKYIRTIHYREVE